MNTIEKQILRKVCEALIADGYLITVDYERGYDSEPENRCLTNVNQIIHAADAVDNCWIMVDREPREAGPYDGFVYFIWDNGNDGRDCITDYSIFLDPFMDPILTWIDESDLVLRGEDENS